MKSIKILGIIGLVAGLCLTQAHASIALGFDASQPANAGAGTISTWLNTLITSYNGANDPDLPAPATSAGRVNNGDTPPSGYPSFGDNTLSITIPTGGYDYLVLHWGNGNTTYPYQAYYIGTDADLLAGTVTFTNDKNGLSWYELFDPKPDYTPVPEPSTVIAGALLLLPFGVSTFRILRKKSVV